MTGTLTAQNADYAIKRTNVDTASDTTDATKYWSIYHYDKNNKLAAYWQTSFNADGRSLTSLGARRIVNGTNYSNTLNMSVNKDGTYGVSFGGAGAAGWRKALGLGSSTGALPLTIAQGGTGQTAITKVTTIDSIITVNTANATITAAQYVQFGKIAQIYIQWKNVNAITVPAGGNITNVGIGTLVSGKRPAILTGAWSHGDNGGAAWYNLGTAGGVSLGACEATGTARTIAAGTVFTLFATYILA